ncbi:MAG TPA: hypothetical protein VNQ55_05665 [Parapedobacter sp.]|nr:hypothetical protein [Parapedobacter sp.]
MKRILMLVLYFFAPLFQVQVLAGEVFGISAYGKVGFRDVSQNYIDLVSISPINCSGTLTDKIRILVYGGDGGGNLDMANAAFISIAEIIAAAKSGFIIETLETPTYDAAKGGCRVTNYLIHLQ